jgi:methylase of polypeptide subunit release factors
MRVCWRSTRCFSSSRRSLTDPLALLLRNKELDIDDARNELRWMKQALNGEETLADLVDRRSRGEPLQYILGTQLD